jgi:hypothetical protein
MPRSWTLPHRSYALSWTSGCGPSTWRITWRWSVHRPHLKTGPRLRLEAMWCRYRTQKLLLKEQGSVGPTLAA